jgi:hypothetical protein
MFSCSLRASKSHDGKRHLIHRHFANVVRPSELPEYNNAINILIQGKGKLSPELDIKFLSCEDEVVLLYLMLTGSKNFRPFTFDTAYAKPAVSILKNDLTKPFVNSPGDTHNSSSEKYNGDFIESLMGVVLCACSHYGGVKGIGIDSYLRHILEEVHDSYPKISIESLVRIDEYDSSLDLMTPSSYFKPEHSLSLTVPYFSPPNSDWPKELYESQIGNFAYFILPKNAVRLDAMGETQRCWGR